MHKLREWRNAHIIIIAVSLNVYKGRAEKHTKGDPQMERRTHRQRVI